MRNRLSGIQDDEEVISSTYGPAWTEFDYKELLFTTSVFLTTDSLFITMIIPFKRAKFCVCTCHSYPGLSVNISVMY